MSIHYVHVAQWARITYSMYMLHNEHTICTCHTINTHYIRYVHVTQWGCITYMMSHNEHASDTLCTYHAVSTHYIYYVHVMQWAHVAYITNMSRNEDIRYVHVTQWSGITYTMSRYTVSTHYIRNMSHDEHTLHTLCRCHAMCSTNYIHYMSYNEHELHTLICTCHEMSSSYICTFHTMLLVLCACHAMSTHYWHTVTTCPKVVLINFEVGLFLLPALLSVNRLIEHLNIDTTELRNK